MKRLPNSFYDPIGSVRRINPVGSFFALCLLGTAALADEPVWTIQDGKILKDDVVFVESGIEAPVGILPAKNGSVIVAQPNELTQIFDEDGDGKGDFFRALISGLPLDQRIVSGPIVSAAGEIYVAVDRAGEMVDLISWAPGKTNLALSLPNTARNLAIDADNVLSAIVSDNEGVWIAMAQLTKPPEAVPAPKEGAEPPLRAVPVALPTLEPAVRIPKSLVGEGNTISDLAFASDGGFQLTISDGNILNVAAAPIDGRIQGSVIPAVEDPEVFAVQGIQLRTDGFSIVLNQPIDRGVGGVETIPFQILSGKLIGEIPLEPIPLLDAIVEPDGKTLNLIPAALLPERVYVFDFSALKAETGEPLIAEKAAYTVIKIPVLTVTPPMIVGDIVDATTIKKPEVEVGAEDEKKSPETPEGKTEATVEE